MTPDYYTAFRQALDGWVLDHGVNALAQSFYGRPDAVTAAVPDVGGLPLFGFLHYLIRSQGCSRVIETGTARGVSAACLASAVAHRESPVVLTFDTAEADPLRDDLWARLPVRMQDCIVATRMDSLKGLGGVLSAVKSGFTLPYHAALLDSRHDAEHVLAEFELARQLVCPGGLILIHDVTLPGATVGEALEHIRADGYGVVELWGADGGVREDNGLGLAVVVNRRRWTADVPGAGSRT